MQSFFESAVKMSSRSQFQRQRGQSNESDQYCHIPQDTRRLPSHSAEIRPHQTTSAYSHPPDPVQPLPDQACSRFPEFNPSHLSQYDGAPPPHSFSNPPPHFSSVPPDFSKPPPSFRNIPPGVLDSSCSGSLARIPNHPSDVSGNPGFSAPPRSFQNPDIATDNPTSFPRSLPLPPRPLPLVSYEHSNIPVSYDNQGTHSFQPNAGSHSTREFVSPRWPQQPPPSQTNYQPESQTGRGHIYDSQYSIELSSKDKFSSDICEDEQDDTRHWLEAFEKRLRQDPQPKKVTSGKRTVKVTLNVLFCNV